MQTRSALLDEAEVESGRVRDRLDVVVRLEVRVAARDRRERSFAQAGDRLREGVAEVRVLVVAAIARPPGRVDGELHQVRETPDLLRTRSFAARQYPEPVEVDPLGAARLQKRVDERRVAELVVGVV